MPRPPNSFFKALAALVFFLFLFAFVRSQTQAEDHLKKYTRVYFLRHAQTLANATGNYSKDNEKKFSSLGNAQIRELSNKLKGKDFDFILVSPAYRATRTISPYLELSRKKAEIWPELAECCWQAKPTSSYAAGIAQVELASRLIRERFSGTGKTILIVGHSLSGSRLIELLLGLEPKGRFGLDNAALACLKQHQDGEFKLILLNDAVFKGTP